MVRRSSWSLFLLLLLLIGCNSIEEAEEQQLHFVLTGESEHWKLSDYELQYSDKRYKAGNGSLKMKGTDDYTSDHFSLGIRVIMNGVEEEVHSHSVSGSDLDIANPRIGTIEGSLHYEDGFINKEDIDRVYATVRWQDSQRGRGLKERIELYDREADNID